MDIQHLYKEYYNRLVFYAMEYVKQKDVAEDIVADVFIRVWKREGEVHRSFLYVSVRNACYDWIILQKIHKRHHDIIELTISPVWGDTDEYNKAYSEYIYLLNALLNSLSPRRKAVMELYLKGHTTEEIRMILNVSGQTVRNLKTGAIMVLNFKLREIKKKQ